MILDSSIRYKKLPLQTAGRCTVRRNTEYKTVELENELYNIEQKIDDIKHRTRLLADELGARYAIFRCAGHRYDDARELRNADIMKLSRQTDEFIQSIYYLEEKRNELLHKIGK